jgi:hypothetical protein
LAKWAWTELNNNIVHSLYMFQAAFILLYRNLAIAWQLPGLSRGFVDFLVNFTKFHHRTETGHTMFRLLHNVKLD